MNNFLIQVSEIDNPNSNSIVKSHTDDSGTKVALGEHVDIVCSGPDYKLAHKTSESKIEQYATCEQVAGTNPIEVKLTVADPPPEPNWCLGKNAYLP